MDKLYNKKKYIGYAPFPHQRAVHHLLGVVKGAGRIIVVKSGRQIGKSLVIENELLRQSINHSKVTNIALSPTLAQSRKLFNDIIKAIGNTDIYDSSNATLLEIKLSNGSNILFKSAEQKESLRGFTVDYLLCIDEAAYIPDEIFYTVLPWTQANNANILMVSTPRFKRGFFYQYWTMEDDNIYHIDFNEYDTSKLLSPQKKAFYKKVYPKSQYKSEIEGEFLDDDAMVFPGLQNVIANTALKPTDYLYVGIDWANGGGNDRTVISVFNQNKQQVKLHYFNDLTPVQQIDRIYLELEPYLKQVRTITCEVNSLGTPMTDMLRQKLKHTNIIDWTTTNTSKNDLVTKMQVGIENTDITLLDNITQQNEFEAYQLEFNQKTKTVTYNAPSGLHDDIVMATMIAYNSIQKNNAYNIGFGLKRYN